LSIESIYNLYRKTDTEIAMIDIQNYIVTEMTSRGIDRFKASPIFLDVNTPDVILDLNKYIYLFASEQVDTKIHTKIELISPDNYFAFSKNTLNTSAYTQYKFFSEELEILTSNYGEDASTFIPFRLEFWKIIPETISDNCIISKL